MRLHSVDLNDEQIDTIDRALRGYHAMLTILGGLSHIDDGSRGALKKEGLRVANASSMVQEHMRGDTCPTVDPRPRPLRP